MINTLENEFLVLVVFKLNGVVVSILKLILNKFLDVSIEFFVLLYLSIFEITSKPKVEFFSKRCLFNLLFGVKYEMDNSF